MAFRSIDVKRDWPDPAKVIRLPKSEPSSDTKMFERNMENLRVLKQNLDAPLREAALQARMDQLSTLNRDQERIITSIAYRHLMEKLPRHSLSAETQEQSAAK